MSVDERRPISSPSGTSPPSAASRHWREFADRLGDVGERLHQLADGSRTPEQHGEINHTLLAALNMGSLYFLRLDPDHPEWLPAISSTLRSANPNPDFVYNISRIRGSGVYRMTGVRGSSKFVELQVDHGAAGFTERTVALGTYDIDAFEIAPDGSFEVILSATRPEGHKGNWVQLDPNAEEIFLLLRQFSYDWHTETEGRFGIQRIDRPIAQPRRTADDVAGQLARVAGFVDLLSGTLFKVMQAQDAGDCEPNVIENVNKKFAGQSLVSNQAYCHGDLVIGPDEALIMEVEPPADCPYWAVQMMDRFYNAHESMFHQSGLNGHTAQVDPDGKIRFVVAHKDPGVPNWLDAMGYEKSSVRYRWYRSGGADVATKLVPLSEVRGSLHPQTPVVSAEQRQEALRTRVAGYQGRRRW